MDGIDTARATSIARLMSSRVTSRWWAVTATWPVEFRLSTCCAADAHEGAVDLPAREALGALDGVRDRPDGLVDVDDGALACRPGGRHGAVAHDRQAAVAADLADEGADLGRADVDADQDRFPFHVRCDPPTLAGAR